MVLSQPDIRKAVEDGHIAFSPVLEDDQWGEASVDLRLGFSFTILRKDLSDVKIAVADGLRTLGVGDFWRTKELREKDELGKAETYTVEPGEFVLAMTHERVTVPRDMIALIEGRSTYGGPYAEMLGRAFMASYQRCKLVQAGSSPNSP